MSKGKEHGEKFDKFPPLLFKKNVNVDHAYPISDSLLIFKKRLMPMTACTYFVNYLQALVYKHFLVTLKPKY